MFWVSEQIHLSEMLWGMKTKKVAEELRGAELEGRQKVCLDQRRNNLNFFINLIVFSPRPHGKTLTNCKSFSSASCLGSKSARINHSQILKEKLHKLQKIIKTSFWVQVLFVWTVLLFFHVWLGWSDWATNQLGTIASSLITPTEHYLLCLETIFHLHFQFCHLSNTNPSAHPHNWTLPEAQRTQGIDFELSWVE